MSSPRQKRTKIIATLGPSSDKEDTLRAMIAAGMNVVRINFSHAKHDALRKTLMRVRCAAAETGTPWRSWAICEDRASGSAKWRAGRSRSKRARRLS